MKKYEEKRKEQNGNGQIIKIHAYNSFLEVIAPTEEFYKVTMNFVEYDKKTNKQTKFVSIFFDVPEFIGFINRIKNREVKKVIDWDKDRCKASNLQYSDLTLSPSFDRDKNGNMIPMMKGSRNKDGEVEARHFWICSGSTTDVLFCAKKGDGEEFGTGTVKFKKNASTTTVRVPMTYQVMENMAEYCLVRLSAIETAFQMKGVYNRMEYRAEENEPTESVQTPAQPVAQTEAQPETQTAAQPVVEPAVQPVVQETPAAHVVSGTFTSDFQKLADNVYVANMKIGEGEYPIYFRGDVPNGLRKAQEFGSAVTINVYEKNGKIAFDSCL